MPKARTLSVIPNRFLSLDSFGRPNAIAMRVDTVRPEPIGATLKPVAKEGDELEYVYADEPTTLADRPEHRKLLSSRQVLPADEATAKLVGVEFEPVTDALETERRIAVERHLAETGEESEHLHPVLPPPKAPTPALVRTPTLPPPAVTSKTLADKDS